MIGGTKSILFVCLLLNQRRSIVKRIVPEFDPSLQLLAVKFSKKSSKYETFNDRKSLVTTSSKTSNDWCDEIVIFVYFWTGEKKSIVKRIEPEFSTPDTHCTAFDPALQCARPIGTKRR